MLFPGPMTAYNFTYDNWGTNPSTTPGTAVTPGASNVEGSWTQIASSANIAQDCYWLDIMISGGATATTSKMHLMDIGVDPAGGTSYTAIISNIACGGSNAISPGSAPGGMSFLFPYYIKAGSSVAVRVQGNAATAGTVRIMAKFFGQPTNPLTAPVGAIAQTFGTITNSNGTSFTPGNAADGSWVSLGTATTPLWWWQLGVQIDNTVQSTHSTYIDIAAGDVTNKKIISRSYIGTNTSESLAVTKPANIIGLTCYYPVPSGTEIWIRGRNSAAPVTGYNATVIGIGG